MKRHLAWIVGLVIAALAIACTTTLSSLDSSRVSEIREGITTKAEIRSWFGEPQDLASSGRTEIWSYIKEQSLNPAANVLALMGGVTALPGVSANVERAETLTVHFTEGVVSKYAYTKHARNDVGIY